MAGISVVFLCPICLLFAISIDSPAIKLSLFAVLCAFLRYPLSIFLVHCRLSENVKMFSLLSILEVLLSVGMTLILVFDFGALGRVIGILISVAALGFWSFYTLYKMIQPKGLFSIDRPRMVRILKISLPVLPHLISSWFRSGLDKIIVGSFYGLLFLGIYSVASQLGLVMAVIGNAITLSFGPHLNKMLKEGGREKDVVKLTYQIIFGVVLFSLCFVFISYVFVPILLGEKYVQAIDYVPVFVFKEAAQVIANLFVGYIYYSEKTNYFVSHILPFSLVNAVLMYVVGANFDEKGFLYFLCFQSFCNMLLIIMVGQKCYPMPFFGRAIK